MHDRREIGARIEGHALHEGQPQGRQRNLRNGIAIRPRPCDGGGGKCRPRAGAILRQYLHAKGTGCGFGKAAHLHIGGAAWREGHQQRDGARWKALCCRKPWCDGRCGEGGEKYVPAFHVFAPCFYCVSLKARILFRLNPRRCHHFAPLRNFLTQPRCQRCWPVQQQL